MSTLVSCRWSFYNTSFLWVGSLALHQPLYPRGEFVPALVASYDMHGRAVGLFYTQPTGQYQRLWGGSNPWHCTMQDSRTLLTELFQPHLKGDDCNHLSFGVVMLCTRDNCNHLSFGAVMLCTRDNCNHLSLGAVMLCTRDNCNHLSFGAVMLCTRDN